MSSAVKYSIGYFPRKFSRYSSTFGKKISFAQSESAYQIFDCPMPFPGPFVAAEGTEKFLFSTGIKKTFSSLASHQ